MANASTLEDMSPGLVKVVEPYNHESHQRKSRMVEISLSGSGEGPGWVTSRPTLQRPFPAASCAAPSPPFRPPAGSLACGLLARPPAGRRTAAAWPCGPAWRRVTGSGPPHAGSGGARARPAPGTPERVERDDFNATAASKLMSNGSDSSSTFLSSTVCMVSGADTTFRAISGTDGQNHKCTVSATCSDADVLQADLIVEVRDL